MGRFSPVSSWNWLANRTNAARLASSRMILSWSFSVIEGTPPVVDRQAGGDQTITYSESFKTFFPARTQPPPGAWNPTDCDRWRRQISSQKMPSKQRKVSLSSGPSKHGLHADREAHVAPDLQFSAHEGGGRVQLAHEDLHVVAGVG